MSRLLLDTPFLVDADRSEASLDELIDDDDEVAIAAITVAGLIVGVLLADEAHREDRTGKTRSTNVDVRLWTRQWKEGSIGPAGVERGSSVGSHRIVVGVDGSPSSMRALEWAAAEAKLRGAALEILHVDTVREVAMEALAPGVLAFERSVLDEAMTRARTLGPDVSVTGRMCDPPAGRALVEVSDGADMLVVGCRGLSGLQEVTLGSVSSQCAAARVLPGGDHPPG